MLTSNPIYNYSVTDIKVLLETLALDAIREKCEQLSALIVCQGFIVNLEEITHYSKHYNVGLVTNNDQLLLEISKELVAEHGLVNGMYVSVTGKLIANVYQQKLTFRLNVTNVRRCEISQSKQYANDLINLELIRKYKKELYPFPEVFPIKLTIVYPRSSKFDVKEDFLKPLASNSNLFVVNSCPINIQSKNEIIDALANVKADILVIIRGGGDFQHFTVFNDEAILKKMSELQCYRITGIGHSKQMTVLDMICDYSASTPTAAGYHIVEKLNLIIKRKEELATLNSRININSEQFIKAKKSLKKYRRMLIFMCLALGGMLIALSLNHG